MSTGDILLLVGLGLATVGGALLAYDAIFGAGARFRARVAATKLEIYKAFRAEQQELIRSNAAYSEVEKKTELEKEKTKHGPEEDDLTQRAASVVDNYEDKVVTLATYGVFLLIVAFVLQFIGTLMVALGHAS